MVFLNRFKTSHKLVFIMTMFIVTFILMAWVFNYTQLISETTRKIEERYMEI